MLRAAEPMAAKRKVHGFCWRRLSRWWSRWRPSEPSNSRALCVGVWVCGPLPPPPTPPALWDVARAGAPECVRVGPLTVYGACSAPVGLLVLFLYNAQRLRVIFTVTAQGSAPSD